MVTRHVYGGGAFGVALRRAGKRYSARGHLA